MAVGTTVSSVFGGSADPSQYSLYNGPAEQSSQPTWSDANNKVFKFYQELRDLRESSKVDVASCKKLHNSISEESIENWLLYFEFYEFIIQHDNQIAELALSQLLSIVGEDKAIHQLVNQGLERINNPIA